MPTTLVNLRLEPCEVYIGRTRPGYQNQGWGNPHFGMSRESAVALHMFTLREKLKREPGLLKKIIETMAGKKLGCWCHPAPCHGDNYIQILKENGYE